MVSCRLPIAELATRSALRLGRLRLRPIYLRDHLRSTCGRSLICVAPGSGPVRRRSRGLGNGCTEASSPSRDGSTPGPICNGPGCIERGRLRKRSRNGHSGGRRATPVRGSWKRGRIRRQGQDRAFRTGPRRRPRIVECRFQIRQRRVHQRDQGQRARLMRDRDRCSGPGRPLAHRDQRGSRRREGRERCDPVRQ